MTLTPRLWDKIVRLERAACERWGSRTWSDDETPEHQANLLRRASQALDRDAQWSVTSDDLPQVTAVKAERSCERRGNGMFYLYGHCRAEGVGKTFPMEVGPYKYRTTDSLNTDERDRSRDGRDVELLAMQWAYEQIVAHRNGETVIHEGPPVRGRHTCRVFATAIAAKDHLQRFVHAWAKPHTELPSEPFLQAFGTAIQVIEPDTRRLYWWENRCWMAVDADAFPVVAEIDLFANGGLEVALASTRRRWVMKPPANNGSTCISNNDGWMPAGQTCSVETVWKACLLAQFPDVPGWDRTLYQPTATTT